MASAMKIVNGNGLRYLYLVGLFGLLFVENTLDWTLQRVFVLQTITHSKLIAGMFLNSHR